MRTRVPAIVLGILLTLGASVHAQGQSAVSDRLDETFRKYAKRFFGPGIDWRLFKAQGMTESGLNPEATSRVGARGIMQLMPSTYLEVRSKNPDISDLIVDPDMNIAAGIYYDRRLWTSWKNGSDAAHRWDFTFASYNAGLSTLQRAQKVAEGRALDYRLWPSIQAVATDVPRWRHQETITYVQRIQANMARMNTNGKVVKK